MGTNWRLKYIRTEDVDAFWDAWLGPWLQRAFDKAPSDYTPALLKEYALADRVRFWVAIDGDAPAAVCATGQQPDGTIVLFALAGSRMQEWVEPISTAFAKLSLDAGFSKVRMAGRKGWVRPLTRLGFKPVGLPVNGRVIMEKEL